MNDILKELVTGVRRIQGRYKTNEIYINLDSKNIEEIIYYHLIIKKLTKVDLKFLDEENQIYELKGGMV